MHSEQANHDSHTYHQLTEIINLPTGATRNDVTNPENAAANNKVTNDVATASPTAPILLISSAPCDIVDVEVEVVAVVVAAW